MKLNTDSCTYADDLTIQDQALLSTLCLFYDEVALPHPYEIDPACEAVMMLSSENERYREIERRRYLDWKGRYRELFDSGALRVLPSPIKVADMPRDLEGRICLQLGPEIRRLSSSDVLEGRVALAMHALYAHPVAPDLVLRPASTATISSELAQTIFRASLPLAGPLHPEQILELRLLTGRYRQGFRSYLASLADDVEMRTRRGLGTKEAAVTTYERVIEPEMLEYFRQELPNKLRWWGAAVKAAASGAASTMKLLAMPLSFSNYASLAKDFGDLVKTVGDEAAKRLTNKNQAFQFVGQMRRVSD